MSTHNQTIELVKKRLDNPESVSKEELRKAAYAYASAPVNGLPSAYAYSAVTSYAFADAYDYDDAFANAAAKHWINKYEGLKNE
jgi:hypothetical protein